MKSMFLGLILLMSISVFADEAASSCSVGGLTIPRAGKDPVIVPGCSVTCDAGQQAVCHPPKVISAHHYSYASCKCKSEQTANPVSSSDIARLLINNPLKQLPGFPGCNDNLVEASSVKVDNWITSYRLTLIPGGFCPPKKVIVTILEDTSATTRDGPRMYKTTFKVMPF